MKRLLLLVALLAVSSTAVYAKDTAPTSTAIWYDGPKGLLPDDIRLPQAVPVNVRQRFQAEKIHASRTNSWMPWVTVFAARNSSGGRVAVFRLAMDWKVERNGQIETVEARHQVWPQGETVWGGWFPYDDNGWFQNGMIAQNDFEIIGWVIERQDLAAVLIDTKRHPNACGHIWQKDWPRLVAPVGTIGVQISCTMAIEGDALVHVGLDRYKSATEDDQPEQEVLVSDTYGEEHCLDGRLTITLVTSRIHWPGQ